MMTFYQLYSRYTAMSKDTSAANVTLGKSLINEKHFEIVGLKDWPFLEKERTSTSVADQQKYRLPPDYGRLMALWTEVDSVYYYPDEVTDLEQWWEINSSGSTVTGNITSRFAIIEDYVHLYPTPSSTDVTIHLLYKRNPVELSVDDYTTGTISNTVATRTVTGAGTTFTSAMEGRFIKIAGLWYEIQTYVSGTSLTLAEYTVKGASAETTHIGEVSLLPEGWEDILWKGALAEYFGMKGEETRAAYWRNEYERRAGIGRHENAKGSLMERYGSKTASQIIKPKRVTGSDIRNPNDYPTGLTE